MWSGPGGFKDRRLPKRRERLSSIAGRRFQQPGELELHDLHKLAVVGIRRARDGVSHMLEGDFRALDVMQPGAGHPERKQLIDIIERRLALHVRPAAALDDESRAHGRELALERR